MPPAARLTDMHTCPMQTPAWPSPIPHVGGPIVGPGAPTVVIGKLPAAVMGDNCVCVGPPDTIIKGSSTVMICGNLPPEWEIRQLTEGKSYWDVPPL